MVIFLCFCDILYDIEDGLNVPDVFYEHEYGR